MITACNIRNYSIYLYGDLLFSYYEYVGEDHAADMARMGADPATQRWWQLTDPCQQQVPEAKPGEWWSAILEVFHHRAMLNVPPKGACVDLTLETHGREHAALIVTALADGGFGVERLDTPEA